MVDTIADTADYSVNLVGELGLLPEALRLRLVSAQQRSGTAPGNRVRVNVAVPPPTTPPTHTNHPTNVR